MREEIETLYDRIYQQMVQYQNQLITYQKKDLSEVEREQIERIEIALQASKDILENMLTPGKKLTFIYEKGTFSIEMHNE